MHPQLHEPDSTRQIETVVDGETVRGTVHLIGSSRIKVKLDWPTTDLWAGKSISFFSRVPEGEPGYLGKFGETLAMDLLLSVYEEYKKGDWRRQSAGARFKEFGHVRYLAINPGYPGRDVKIREKVDLDASVYVQLEGERDRVWASKERVDLEASLARTRQAMENFEARGKEHQAAECRAKIRKLELRVDAKTLSLTPAGKSAVYVLPYQVELTSQVL